MRPSRSRKPGGDLAEKNGYSRCPTFCPASIQTDQSQACFRGSSQVTITTCSCAARAKARWSSRSNALLINKSRSARTQQTCNLRFCATKCLAKVRPPTANGTAPASRPQWSSWGASASR